MRAVPRKSGASAPRKPPKIRTGFSPAVAWCLHNSAVCSALSKSKHNPCRQPQVVLRRPKESRLHIASLEAPRNRADEYVVHAAPQSCGKRRVGTCAIRAHMPGPDQDLGKGTELAHRHRHPRPEHNVLFMHTRTRAASRCNTRRRCTKSEC